MNIFVPNFDSFSNLVNEMLEQNPGDHALLQARAIIDNCDAGDGVYQLAADASNLTLDKDEKVFSVVQLHADDWSYPEDFFENFTLVLTMNFDHTRMDIFCTRDTDPGQVFAQFATQLAQSGISL